MHVPYTVSLTERLSEPPNLQVVFSLMKPPTLGFMPAINNAPFKIVYMHWVFFFQSCCDKSAIEVRNKNRFAEL